MEMEQEKLKALVEQARQGDPAAQESLLAAVQNRVYYHCKKMLKHEQDAQDAAQDVLIAVRGWTSCGSRRPFGAG